MQDAWLFVLPVTLILVVFAARVWKNRGLRGAMFGAPVLRTLGELDLGRRGMMKTTLKVHSLQESDEGVAVGIEVLATTFGSFSMAPIPLTRQQASELARLLTQAASEN